MTKTFTIELTYTDWISDVIDQLEKTMPSREDARNLMSKHSKLTKECWDKNINPLETGKRIIKAQLFSFES